MAGTHVVQARRIRRFFSRRGSRCEQMVARAASRRTLPDQTWCSAWLYFHGKYGIKQNRLA
jgi:hypothetical protein